MEDRKKQELARAAAARYAKILKEQNLKPGETMDPAKLAALMAEAEKLERIEETKPEEAKEIVEAPATPVTPVVAETPKKKEKKEKKPRKEDGFISDCLLLCEAFGDIFAWMIDLHDKIQSACDKVLYEMGHSLIVEIFKMVKNYRLSRRKIAISTMQIVLLTCAMFLVFDQSIVYEYAYNGRVLGYVNNQEDVTDVLEVAGDELSKNNDVGIDFKIGDNITFKTVSSNQKTVDSSDEAINKLAYMTDIEVEAWGVYEDGKLVTVLESEAVANNAVETAKNIQGTPDEGMKVVSVDFKNKIEIKPLTVMITSVQTRRNAIKHLTEGGKAEFEHIVNQDESIKTIANDFGVTKDDIYDGVTEKKTSKVEVGDKVIIKKEIKPIEVELVEDGRMTEIIPYTTERVNDNKMYKGDTAVTQNGIDGRQVIDGKVTKINGVITKRDLRSKDVITKMQSKVIHVGTAERPKTAPTGIFGMPIRNYTLTSRYGYRWGRTHQGLDMAAPTGTPIYASDGGTVTIAGWQQGYGNVVYIDHGNGRTTRYGHNSRLTVTQGQKVYKGQQIALCGSTGNSTGPHLHFEIRINGKAIDPGPVLGIY